MTDDFILHCVGGVDRRRFIQSGVPETLGLAVKPGWRIGAAVTASASEVLYNGIRLPTPWPPQNKTFSRDPPPSRAGLASPVPQTTNEP